MIQIEIDKILPESKFSARIRTGPESGPVFFTKNDNQQVYLKFLSNVKLSQLMSHKYSPKILGKSLSRNSQSASGTRQGTKFSF
jgi:hypothetical protein